MITTPETLTATVRLSGEGSQLETEITVPNAPMYLRQALPLVQALADQVVDAGVQMAEAQGEHVSCKKGCGACCRQMVPIAEVEARNIRAVVEALPEPRRTVVKERFAAARQRLAASDLLEKMEKRSTWSTGEGRTVGVEYFAQGIPCPFLEDESCSIYTDRPVACHEYLVTSPAENCAHPTPETIQMVKIPMKVWTALARFDPVPPGASSIRWVPLILAPEWADAHPEEPPPRPGPELARQLFDFLVKRQGPATAAPERPTDAAEL